MRAPRSILVRQSTSELIASIAVRAFCLCLPFINGPAIAGITVVLSSASNGCCPASDRSSVCSVCSLHILHIDAACYLPGAIDRANGARLTSNVERSTRSLLRNPRSPLKCLQKYLARPLSASKSTAPIPYSRPLPSPPPPPPPLP